MRRLICSWLVSVGAALAFLHGGASIARAEPVLPGSACGGGVNVQAIEACTAIVASSSDATIVVRALYERGAAYYFQGDRAQALADFEEVVRRRPDYAGGYGMRGQMHAEDGRFAQGISDLNIAISIDPTAALWFHARGQAYHAQGDYERAIADFTEAVRIAPDYDSAFSGRGRSRNQTRDFSGAIADFDEALRLRQGQPSGPRDALIHFMRGNAYRGLEDYDRAFEDYERVLQIEPRYVGALVNRGHVFSMRGDYQRALADYEQALRFDPQNSSALEGRANALQRIEAANQ